MSASKNTKSFFDFMQSANTARHSDGLTTMLSFSISPPVFEASQVEFTEQGLQIGLTVARVASWWEGHGEKELLNLERWREVAPNMFVKVTS